MGPSRAIATRTSPTPRERHTAAGARRRARSPYELRGTPFGALLLVRFVVACAARLPARHKVRATWFRPLRPLRNTIFVRGQPDDSSWDVNPMSLRFTRQPCQAFGTRRDLLFRRP
jgi:hypothetical protein